MDAAEELLERLTDDAKKELRFVPPLRILTIDTVGYEVTINHGDDMMPSSWELEGGIVQPTSRPLRFLIVDGDCNLVTIAIDENGAGRVVVDRVKS